MAVACRCVLRWRRLRLAVYFAAWVQAPDPATVYALQASLALQHLHTQLLRAALQGLASAVAQRTLKVMATTLWVRFPQFAACALPCKGMGGW